jgi:hypothetical protein
MRVVTPAGLSVDLGTTETTPTIGITDYSKRVTDDYGVTTVVERGFARRMSARLAVPFDDTGALQQRLAGLRATSALWIADERFAWLSAQGFYKDFSLDLNVSPLSFCTLTIEGLAETEIAADAGGDPAPDGQASTLQLIQPVTVTDAVLAASNVAEADYPEWAAGTSYAAGMRVVRAATHRIYESAAVLNVGNDPIAASGEWIDVGPTDRWAMFDQALGTATTWNGSIVVTLLPGAVNAVALLDVVAATVRVQAAGYERTVAAGAGAIPFLDLPETSGPVTVTIAGDGQVSVGTLLIGRRVALGITEASPTAGITDFSRKEVDDFGEVTVVQRAWSKRMEAKALIRTDAVDLVANRIAAVRARPSLWIGQAGVDSLTVYGFFKDFSIEVGENVSKLSLTIEGLSTAAPASPGITWPSITDPTGTKPQDNATVGAPAGTQVAGRPAENVIDDLDRVLSQLSIAAIDLDAMGRALFDLAKLSGTINAYMQAKTTLDGKSMGTAVVEVRTVAESAVESLTLIGAKNAAGTAWNLSLDTVYVDDQTTLAGRLTQIEADGAEGVNALGTELRQVITQGDNALSKRIDTEQVSRGDAINVASQSLSKAQIDGDTALGERIDTVQAAYDGQSAQVSFLTSALVTADGDTIGKAVLSLKAGPDGSQRVGGMIATNTGELVTLDLDFDSTRIFKPDGTLLLQAGPNDEVFMPKVRVNTLENNTAVVPVRTASTSPVAGTHTDPQSPPPRASVLSIPIVMPVPGWIEAQGFGQQAYAGNSAGDAYPYGASISVNGAQIPEAVAGGATPDNNWSLGGFFYAATPGTYTVALAWGGITNITLRERVLFVKGYPFTE